MIFPTDVTQNSAPLDGRSQVAVVSGRTPERIDPMLWTLIVVLLLLWALGVATSFGGGLIHLLLAIALIVLVIRLISGRRVI